MNGRGAREIIPSPSREKRSPQFQKKIVEKVIIRSSKTQGAGKADSNSLRGAGAKRKREPQKALSENAEKKGKKSPQGEERSGGSL